MTDEEWNEAKKTMPWVHTAEVNGLGRVIRLLDCKGKEVPIHIMIAVVERLSAHLGAKN